MAFCLDTRNATRIRSYEDAAKLFQPPHPIQRGAEWKKDERPLDGKRKHHMRVVQGPNADYYDVMLYETALGRFFRPVGNEQHVWYDLYSSVSSNMFREYVLNLYTSRRYKTTDGRQVVVGLNSEKSKGFDVQLLFVDGLLDVARSKDSPDVRSLRTSKERIEKRKALRKWLVPYEVIVAMEPKLVRPWFNYQVLRNEMSAGFEQGLDFDDDVLVASLHAIGSAGVVNYCYPTGDAPEYYPPFHEVSE